MKKEVEDTLLSKMGDLERRTRILEERQATLAKNLGQWCELDGHKATWDWVCGHFVCVDPVCKTCGKTFRPEAWVDPEPQEAGE